MREYVELEWKIITVCNEDVLTKSPTIDREEDETPLIPFIFSE